MPGEGGDVEDPPCRPLAIEIGNGGASLTIQEIADRDPEMSLTAQDDETNPDQPRTYQALQIVYCRPY